jgi:hypothetical protein
MQKTLFQGTYWVYAGACVFGPFLRAGCAGAAWVRGGGLGSSMGAGRRCLAQRVGGIRWLNWWPLLTGKKEKLERRKKWKKKKKIKKSTNYRKGKNAPETVGDVGRKCGPSAQGRVLVLRKHPVHGRDHDASGGSRARPWHVARARVVFTGRWNVRVLARHRRRQLPPSVLRVDSTPLRALSSYLSIAFAKCRVCPIAWSLRGRLSRGVASRASMRAHAHWGPRVCG